MAKDSFTELEDIFSTLKTCVPGFSGSFGTYDNLTFLESQIISQYHNDYDKALIVSLLNSNIEKSDDMNRFIADVMAGKIKRPRGKKKHPTVNRDSDLYQQVTELLAQGLPLRDSKKKKGAGKTVSVEVYGHDGHSEAIITAYQRGKKEADQQCADIRDLQSWAGIRCDIHRRVWRR